MMFQIRGAYHQVPNITNNPTMETKVPSVSSNSVATEPKRASNDLLPSLILMLGALSIYALKDFHAILSLSVLNHLTL